MPQAPGSLVTRRSSTIAMTASPRASILLPRRIPEARLIRDPHLPQSKTRSSDRRTAPESSRASDAAGGHVKITRATTYVVGNPWKNWLFVRLDTDQPGLYGVGEGTLNAFARTIEAA